MKIRWNTILTVGAMFISLNLFCAGDAVSAIKSGQKAPGFTLADTNGQQHSLAETQGRQMTVLFFFDAQSSSSQGGLLMLDRLLKKYKDEQLSVWGITRSAPDAIQQFIRKTKIKFPILLDVADVSRQYDAQVVLPVACTLGPEMKVLDYFQGGGKTAEVMLVRLAERQIHRNQPQLAKAIADTVVQNTPNNLEAKAVQGYAALAEGKTDVAKSVFDEIASAPGKDAVIGKEGQAVILARSGKSDKALALVEQVSKEAPNRAVPHKIKGDLLMAKGKRKAAEVAYQAAVDLPEAPTFQKAEAYNQLGRLYAQEKQYGKARGLFDQAIAMDPYYLEPTSNKGVTYEKEGLWSKALAEYRQALSLDQADTMAGILARKAEQMMALQKDTESKKRIDQLVNSLVERYRRQEKAEKVKPEDQWTSRPMIVTLLNIDERGGLASRDGLSIVLATRLGELLDSSGRVQVVERAVIEQLLSELNLGSSELADPQTALQLGKLLAAKLIGTGTLLYLPDSTLLNLRMIDTETTAIAKTITHSLPASADLERELFDLNREILKTVMEKYPLQGYIVKVDGDKAMLNLGRQQGVTPGTTFDVIEEGEQITYKGRVLQGDSKSVARLEVVKVEEEMCFARIVDKKRDLTSDDQVKEVFLEVAMKGN